MNKFTIKGIPLMTREEYYNDFTQGSETDWDPSFFVSPRFKELPDVTDMEEHENEESPYPFKEVEKGEYLVGFSMILPSGKSPSGTFSSYMLFAHGLMLQQAFVIEGSSAIQLNYEHVLTSDPEGKEAQGLTINPE